MEAAWNVEDKSRISTQGAVAVLVICTCSLVIGTCIIAAFRRNIARKRPEDEERCMDDSTNIDCSEPRAELGSVKETLTSTVRWSQKEKLPPLLVSPGQLEADFGMQQNHGSNSPMWQRPILMGEKCELPKFSGLILYDERGRATSPDR
ncbi:PREDICTED: uncharacterized protein LOC109229918 [Nicotiana attenuata]|uniref:Uncharacterized protein n=1 Tax=Nicotiana attenuata TaxID=49451 RepID=A0A1J6IRH8_NICAT|nr:PREDICTED: uncharacterized protein LOC109229918 [Nicotiana attenuata]OIT00319.1 hypothetical protein A4A49_55237 [Nicotiana attenuata]